MPTPEEIKKIARLFAYETSNGDALDPHIDFAEEFAVEVLQWLSKKYCIVPKSKILEDYEFDAGCFAQFSATDNLSNLAQWHKGRCDEIESLFGAELFNEEKGCVI